MNKPDIKELLDLANRAKVIQDRTWWPYLVPIKADKMIALLEYVEELEGRSLPDDKEINQVAIDEACSMKFDSLIYTQIHQEGFEAGAKWIRDKAND